MAAKTLQVGFYVGMNRPFSFLPRWKKFIIRSAYFITNWSCGDGVESMAVCDDELIASAMCKDNPAMFYQPLPLNRSLPEETCTFRKQHFPASEVASAYERLEIPLKAVDTTDLTALLNLVSECLRNETERRRSKTMLMLEEVL